MSATTPSPSPEQQPGWTPAPQGVPGALAPNEERTWASAAHWSTIIVGFVGPLVVMLTKGTQSPFVRRQAVEALNFQLTALIGYLVSGVLMIVLIGFLTFLAVWVVALVFAVTAAVKANKGEDYRYPISIRMVS